MSKDVAVATEKVQEALLKRNRNLMFDHLVKHWGIDSTGIFSACPPPCTIILPGNREGEEGEKECDEGKVEYQKAREI